MKRLEYTRPHDLGALHGEILEVLGPALSAAADEEMAAAAEGRAQVNAANAILRDEAQLRLDEATERMLRLRDSYHSFQDSIAAGEADPALLAVSDQLRTVANAAEADVDRFAGELRAIVDEQLPDVTIRLEERDDTVFITVPDNVDEAAIARVVDAHDAAAAAKRKADQVAEHDRAIELVRAKAAADPEWAALLQVLGVQV